MHSSSYASPFIQAFHTASFTGRGRDHHEETLLVSSTLASKALDEGLETPFHVEGERQGTVKGRVSAMVSNQASRDGTGAQNRARSKLPSSHAATCG